MDMYISRDRGFTLIELLVVIAIIAILVLIVIVAINPVERLNEANDRKAESNVRSYASSIGACVAGVLTRAPSVNPFEATTCGDPTGNYLRTNGYASNMPVGVNVLVADVDGDSINDQICLYEEGRSGGYASWESSVGYIIPSPLGVTSCT